jgi:alkanesulfonate monooxygenase SsuD/methylene tetrahydromethanopterin reductase-like flavin-dependent oxidoreductase (luciferase family)
MSYCKRELGQVSHQTIQETARFAGTQGENVFTGCLTDAAGARMNRRDSQVRQARGRDGWRDCTCGMCVPFFLCAHADGKTWGLAWEAKTRAYA